MPVHREKEQNTETKRKTVTREPSITRKVKREKTEDSRPVVTQDKPTKPKTEKIFRREPSTSSSVDKNKPEIRRTKPKEKEVVKDKKPEKLDSRISKSVPKPEKDKTEKKVRLVKTESRDLSRHEVSKVKKESKKDVITMKEVLEKRITSRMAKESSLKNSPRSKTKESDVFGEVIHKPRRDEKEKMKSKEANRGDYVSREKGKRERTRTRTLSPTEVKQLRKPQIGSGDATESQKLKREDMARGDFNAKMAAVHIGNDDEKDGKESVDQQSEEEEEEDEEYEDDFEDYESDFEEDSEDAQSPDEDGNQEQEERNEEYVTRSHRASISLAEEERKAERIRSGETERKMDSGIYDMKASLHRKEIDEIKLALQKENYEVTERRKSSAAGLDFEIPNEKTKTRDTNSGQMINFSNARKRRQEEKVAAKTKKRGEELLSMISLDAISYSLLEIPATPYDVFMKTYGRSNTQQAHSQINEDDLDEEIQTDEITLTNKWTQNPPEYSPFQKDGTNNSYLPSKEERLGVGGDVPLFLEPLNSHYNTTRLNEFLTTASEIILTALESASGNRFNVDKLSKQKNDFPFADGFLQLNVKDVPFLQKRSILSLCLSTKNTANVLSVHEGSNDGDSFQRCMICLWSIREPSKPSKIMVASNQVTCCCFGPNQGNLIFAGLLDGSICLWDLREPSTCHETTKESQSGWTIRSPTYSTAEILKENGHISKVVAIKLLTKAEDVIANQDFIPIQVCSLEEIGTIIIWTVIQNRSSKKLLPNDDLGLAHWGKVKLIKNTSFSIFSTQREDFPKYHVTCNDLALNDDDENGLYIANSLGNVYHLSTYGSYMKPKCYASNKNDATVETTCLEMCPFDSNYFLVGCEDGSIRLHSRHQEFPLICLNGNVIENGKEAAIVSLTWLYMRPCVFFALDSLSRIHIWDLGVSDMYPEVTLNLANKKVTCMKLASIQDKRHIPYLVLGSKDGSIEVYRLNKDYGARSPEERRKEMKMFLRYVSIL